jgi:hypothetical protein
VSPFLPMVWAIASLAQAAPRPEVEERQDRPAVPIYTNADLERVQPFRDQTGVASTPANPRTEEPLARGKPERGRARGEAYWRDEARRVRKQVRALQDQVAEIEAGFAEREAERHREPLGRHRVDRGRAALDRRRANLQRRIRELEDDLEDRARREGALPGWLR